MLDVRRTGSRRAQKEQATDPDLGLLRSNHNLAWASVSSSLKLGARLGLMGSFETPGKVGGRGTGRAEVWRGLGGEGQPQCSPKGKVPQENTGPLLPRTLGLDWACRQLVPRARWRWPSCEAEPALAAPWVEAAVTTSTPRRDREKTWHF